jgi:MFS family permease
VRIDETGNWRAFRHRNFRILFAANAISNIGTWAQRIAQDWLVLQLTHSGTYLGLVTAAQFTPVLFLSLHGGALADRFDKQKVLIVTNLAGGLSSGILGLLVVTHQVRLWHVFLLAFLLGVANAVDAPVRQSFVAEVVGHSDVGNAVSLNSANFNAGRLIGPGVSGAMIAAFGTGPSFLLNGASYLLVIFSLMKLSKSEFQVQAQSRGLANVREGLRYVKARPDLYAVMIVIFFMATFGLNFQIFNALAATKVFHRGAMLCRDWFFQWCNYLCQTRTLSTHYVCRLRRFHVWRIHHHSRVYAHLCDVCDVAAHLRLYCANNFDQRKLAYAN